MIVAGCDIGSTWGKALIMNNGNIASYTIRPVHHIPVKTAHEVIEEAIRQAGLSSLEDIDYIVGTGYGRLMMIPFAHHTVPEIACHARGAQWLVRGLRTVLDIGGQDCKVVGLHEDGRIREYLYNDKCASGTGRFLERVAKVSSLSLQAQNPAAITSQCSVFAESEIVTLLNQGKEIPDIIAGINEAIASRLATLVNKVGLLEDFTVTGGCANNLGLIAILEEKLGIPVKRFSEDPQIGGALGAAVIAAERSKEGGKKNGDSRP